jgi:hypothetical protein
MTKKEQRTKNKPGSLFPIFRSISYRLCQLSAALGAHISDEDRRLVAQQLSDAEQRLFERMAHFDQRHCLDVYRTLVRAGHDNPLLLRAALIHDCGKVADDGRAIPLLYYGIFVLLKKLAPALYSRAANDGRGLLWPFAVHARHDERGVQLAELAGSPPELVAILRDYAARRASNSAAALLWADEQH